MESNENPSPEIQAAVEKAIEQKEEKEEKAKEEGRKEERRERWHDEQIDHLYEKISALEVETLMLRAEHDALLVDYLEEIGALEEEAVPEEPPPAETPAVTEKEEGKTEATTLPPKPEKPRKKSAWSRMWGED